MFPLRVTRSMGFFYHQRMMYTTARDYADAIDHLNSLQSPRHVVAERRRRKVMPDEQSLSQMRRWLKRLGHNTSDLDCLNIIHVAGTKGKGTVCAFANSILSHSRSLSGVPKRVGLFTSPHLTTVRERITIDSRPISEVSFATYFFEVWDALRLSKDTPITEEVWTTRPNYFRFLTLLSFHVFLAERVDAAVYEVGIGGAFDSTNIIESPAATGITALGIDHVETLGPTIEQIAWHKAGIFKRGVPAFSVAQPPEAEAVLTERAIEKGTIMQVIRPLGAFDDLRLVPNESYQRQNAALAVALADVVLQKLGHAPLISEGRPNPLARHALEQTVWRGRFETLKRMGATWYLDGAHTVDSLRLSGQWFAEVAKPGAARVLVFNQQARINAEQLLKTLHQAYSSRTLLSFTHAIFCTNAISPQTSLSKDNINHNSDSKAVADLTVQRSLATAFSQLAPSAEVHAVQSVEDAVEIVARHSKPQVFVTGSLHLVGGVLSVLEADHEREEKKIKR